MSVFLNMLKYLHKHSNLKHPMSAPAKELDIGASFLFTQYLITGLASGFRMSVLLSVGRKIFVGACISEPN